MRKKETPNPSRMRGRGVEVSETLFYTSITHLSTLTVFLYNEIKNGGADNERNKIPRISG